MEELKLENNQKENENNSKNKEEKEATEKIIVHISGAVQIEGILELEESSRIQTAIEQAGGLKENANINNINLAQKLEDGIKIYIPTNEEINQIERGEINTTTTQLKETIESKATNTTNTKAENKKININTATQTELETLPGIGPSTALKIIEHRKSNGKFQNIDELKEISGIGERKFESIKELIIK